MATLVAAVARYVGILSVKSVRVIEGALRDLACGVEFATLFVSSRNELRYRIYLRKAIQQELRARDRLCIVPFATIMTEKLATNFHFRYDKRLFLRKELLTLHFRYDT